MTAFCDTSTQEIYGCKKGSYVWWHEKGHLIFSRSLEGAKLHLFQQYILLTFFLAIIIAIASIDKLIGLMVAIPFTIYIGIEFAEEIWCWKYARRNFK